MRNIWWTVLLVSIFSHSVTVFAKPIKFIGIGEKGKSGAFKKEITIFQAEGDPKVRCLGCKNFRVILDDREMAMPIGAALGNTLQFDTSKSCGQNAAEPQIADLSALYRHPNSPRMTRNHPLLLVMNPSFCNMKEVVELQLLGQKCLNPTEASCREMEVKKSWEIRASRLQKEFDEVDLEDQEPLPNRVVSERDPGSANSKKSR